jgi:hypothetical protein
MFDSRRRTYEREREKNKHTPNAAARIFSYENLLKCYYECRKRKRYTVNAAKFEIHFEDELLQLQGHHLGGWFPSPSGDNFQYDMISCEYDHRLS